MSLLSIISQTERVLRFLALESKLASSSSKLTATEWNESKRKGAGRAVALENPN
jgi:hypothetical protein